MGHPEVDFNPGISNATAEQLVQQLDEPEQVETALRQGVQKLDELAIIVEAGSAAMYPHYTTDGVLIKPGQVWPTHNPNIELQEAEALERLTQS